MKWRSTLPVLFLLSSLALAQTPATGSWSMLHTHTAKTFEQGRLEIYTQLDFWTKLGDYLGQTPSDFTAVNYWSVGSNILTTYGILNNLDVSLGLRLYQDVQRAEANIPDDLFLTLKAGSFALGTRHLYGAAMLNFRFPLAETPNPEFIEYSSPAVEYGAMAALSYFLDPYLQNKNFATHVNVGWYTHNDAGQEVYPGQKARFNATKLQYGLGFVYPIGMMDLMVELNGISWIEQPDTMVYSREDYMYVTPAIRFRPYHWLYADLGVDIRISEDVEETSGVPLRSTRLDLPNYADWKAWLAVNFTILPLAPTELTPEELERERFKSRVDFFQNIIEERERIENIQEELERLRREREEAEKELEELKQILEEEG
jgi:hypothetical protein